MRPPGLLALLALQSPFVVITAILAWIAYQKIAAHRERHGHFYVPRGTISAALLMLGTFVFIFWLWHRLRRETNRKPSRDLKAPDQDSSHR